MGDNRMGDTRMEVVDTLEDTRMGNNIMGDNIMG